MTATLDIPVHLADRPRSGGLVVPWITPATSTGLYLFGKLTDLSQYRCLTRTLCQVCGHRLGERAVLFARESDLAYQCTAEPAVCPPCAAYSSRACPMLAGRRSRYRASEHPALAGISLSADQLLRQAAPAEPLVRSLGPRLRRDPAPGAAHHARRVVVADPATAHPTPDRPRLTA